MADLRMPDLNNVIIVGNLIKDPVLRQTTNGTPVANFTIASNRRFRDNFGEWKEDVCFVGIVAWYKLAESCAQSLHKGSAVLIKGELQSRQWQLDSGGYHNQVEIKARRIQFLTYNTDELHDYERREYFPADNTQSPTTEQEQPAKSEKGTIREEIDKLKNDDDEGNSEYDFGFRDLKL